MAEEHCNPTLDNGCGSMGSKPKRNHYFHGKQLGVEDFVAEQRYMIQKIRRLGLHIVGNGVVSGLRIDAIREGGTVVTITPGAAVDGCGNLLVVPKKRSFDLERKVLPGDYLYLAYREEGTDKVPRERSEECSDDCCFSRIQEDVAIVADSSLDEVSVAAPCGEQKREATAPGRGRVLLGRYREGGRIDYSDVISLYKIGELSRRLCEISESYVRSLNNRTGDLFAVASVNEATPDENGHLAIEEGNNISIESEGNRLTISSTGSFYHSQLLVLGAGKQSTIRHGFGKIPSVDVYRAVRAYYDKRPAFEAATIREVEKMARAAGIELENYMKRIGAASFDSHMASFNAGHPSMKKRVYTARSRVLTATALSRYGITDFSAKVERVAAYPLERVAKDLVVLPRYHYEKILGGNGESMRIKVRHTGPNSVVVTNSDQEHEATILVVLSA